MYTIYFDTETGGLTMEHPVIQLAAIAVDDRTGKECSSFEAKLQFDENKADPKALEMNHYDRDLWAKEALPPAIVVKRFSRWAEPYESITLTSQRTGRPYTVGKLAGYNALTFDLPRVRALYGTDFFPFTYQVRDILQRVLFHFDEHPDVVPPKDFKLSTVAEYFNLITIGAHDALADVRLTLAVYQRIRA